MTLLQNINNLLEGTKPHIKQAIKNSIVQQVNKTGKLILEVDGENIEYSKKEVIAIWKDVK